MGIRAKLILSTCLPLLVIYVAVLTWDYWKSRQQALQQVEQVVAQRASADASQVNARLASVQQIVNRTAYVLANRPTLLGNSLVSRLSTGGPGSFGIGGPGGPPPGESGPPEPPPGSGPPSEARVQSTNPNGLSSRPLQRGGGGFGGGGGLGGFFAGSVQQSSFINAIWLKTESTVVRNGRSSDTFGVRRINTERRPEDFFPTAAPAAAIATIAEKAGHGVWIDPADAGDVGVGPSCVFAEPFYSMEEGKLLGVVCVSMPADALRFLREDSPVQLQLRRMLGNMPATQATTEQVEPRSLTAGGYLLLNKKGQILSRPDGKEQGKPLAVGPDDDELREAIDHSLKGSGAIVIAGGLDETLGEMAPQARYVLAMEPLPTTGWLYVTAAPESDLVGPVQDRLIKRAIFLSASLVVLIAVVMFVLTRFCRPIEQMAKTVQQIASGDLDTAPVPVHANDEVGQLAKGFNDMTGRLRHHVRELTEQTAEREKVDSELRIARQIQSDLLPRTFPPFPEREEFGLHAVNIPARHIAGDFFDFFFSGDDLLTVVIADVSGKGVPAALMMAVTRTMVRNLAESGLTPRQIVERINRMLVEDTTPGLFVTMVLGQYEPSSGRLTFVNAGHPASVCVSKDGQATMCCPPTGPLLGVDSAGLLGPYEQGVVTLAPGDTILFYTDGVTEAHDASNVLFGEKRLLARVRELAGTAPPDLCEGVVSSVMSYQHQSAADDLTLVALQRR